MTDVGPNRQVQSRHRSDKRWRLCTADSYNCIANNDCGPGLLNMLAKKTLRLLIFSYGR